MQRNWHLSPRTRNWIIALLPTGLALLFFGLLPLFTCPSCDDWCRQVKVTHQPVPTCTICGGNGRVTFLKKDATEQWMEELRASGHWGP